jgi:hypothetical protein
MAQNDGGIKRGDRADTGDNEAQPTVYPKRSEDPTSVSVLEELTVTDADDPKLGLTNIGDVPADDWAADTGPTHSAEADVSDATRANTDRGSTLSPGRKKP